MHRPTYDIIYQSVNLAGYTHDGFFKEVGDEVGLPCMVERCDWEVELVGELSQACVSFSLVYELEGHTRIIWSRSTACIKEDPLVRRIGTTRPYRSPRNNVPKATNHTLKRFTH